MTRLLSLIIICLASTMVPGQGLPEAYFCGKGDHGNKWQLVGPNPAPDMLQAVGLLRSVAVDPVDPNILYVGTEHSGLWKTLDGGDHWENISDTLKVPSLGFTELSINPDNPAEIVAGTRTRSFSYPHWQDMSKGYGLLFSADQGRSWSKAVMREAEEPFQYIEILKRDPHDPDHLLAAGNRKVWQSHDGGREWELVFENPTELPAWFIDLEFSLDDPKVILASTKLHGYGGAKDQGGLRKVPHAAQAFSSVNGGEKGSWREVTPPHTQKAADFAIRLFAAPSV
ncbi:MAG: WD40/YVTN/BNR-like repeat-containing protein [Owenweeksia sp.]